MFLDVARRPLEVVRSLHLAVVVGDRNAGGGRRREEEEEEVTRLSVIATRLKQIGSFRTSRRSSRLPPPASTMTSVALFSVSPHPPWLLISNPHSPSALRSLFPSFSSCR